MMLFLPMFWVRHFIDGVFVAEREVVEDMIGNRAWMAVQKRELALR